MHGEWSKGYNIMPSKSESKGIEQKKLEKISAGGTAAKDRTEGNISGSTGHQGLERKSQKTEL